MNPSEVAAKRLEELRIRGLDIEHKFTTQRKTAIFQAVKGKIMLLDKCSV